MPFVNAKVSVDLNDEQKDQLQQKLTEAVNKSFGKPTQYIMVGIETRQDLYFGGKKMAKGAFVEISLLGHPSGSACSAMTAQVCDILQQQLGIAGNMVYVSYHPIDNWGWNGSNF